MWVWCGCAGCFLCYRVAVLGFSASILVGSGVVVLAAPSWRGFCMFGLVFSSGAPSFFFFLFSDVLASVLLLFFWGLGVF